MKNEEKVNKIAALLEDMSPGFYPKPIFQQFSRLTVNPIIEVVPFRKTKDSGAEILLLEREPDDPIFAGQLHTPGTVVRPYDTPGSFNDALQRIFNDELQGSKTSEPTFVTNIFHHSGRGLEASQIFWVELLGPPKIGSFYPVSNLPKHLMHSQLDFIPIAIEHYLGSWAKNGESV